MERKIVFSGTKPTGDLTLGNYLGAFKNWVNLQNDFNCIYCIVDLHSITVRQQPAHLRKREKDLLLYYLACGIDPDKSLIYYQSHVHEHAELTWVLNCFTYMGELGRMTQYKEKSAKHSDNINSGLFTYPVLMAADILLFDTDLVPVGEDQRQHVEICRDVAMRMNNIYEHMFKIPEGFIPKVGAKIMGLQAPENKMSKSEGIDDIAQDGNVIYLADKPESVMNKIKRAVTDSDNEVRFGADKPGISNLMTIYSCCTGASIADIEKEFASSGYGAFKKAVGEALVEEMRPIQQRVVELSSQKDYLNNLITDGAEKASSIARRTVSRVYKKIGFVPRV